MAVLGILAAIGLAAILWALYGALFCRPDGSALTVVFAKNETDRRGKLIWARCFFAGSEVYLLPEDAERLRELLRENNAL